MYICLCRGITENKIRQAVCEGVSSMRELRACLGVASQCGKCSKSARSILQDSKHGVQVDTSPA